MPEQWMIVTLTASGPSSTLRVHAWRKLRALGALALGQSVYVVPARPATVRAVNRLIARLHREGGAGRVLRVRIDDADEENTLIASFSAERDDEYHEIVERTRQFLAEIEMERERGRTTYTEVEESDADLKRFQRWLAAVKKRDYFGAEAHHEAAAAVEACEQALAAFEAEAFTSELQGDEGDEGIRRRGLRLVENGPNG